MLQKFRDDATVVIWNVGYDLWRWESDTSDLKQVTSVLGLNWREINDTLMLKKVFFENNLSGKIPKRVHVTTVRGKWLNQK